MSTRWVWSGLIIAILGIVSISSAFAAAEATVVNGGNLRSEPRTVPATVLGQVCVGDQMMVLEGQKIGRDVWYRVKVITLTTKACKVKKHPAVGTEGWISGTLLSKPAEAVTIEGGTPARPATGKPPKPTSAPVQNCDPSYPDVCIPPAPPDLDCGDVPYTNFRVIGSDPHRFDRDKDGVGCEK